MADQLIVDGLPPITLVSDRYLIGRGEGCDVLLPETDPGISRRHALLERNLFGEWTLLDLSSRNGTQVNDKTVMGRQSLRDGDLVRIGNCVLMLRLLPTKPTLVTDTSGQAPANVKLSAVIWPPIPKPAEEAETIFADYRPDVAAGVVAEYEKETQAEERPEDEAWRSYILPELDEWPPSSNVVAEQLPITSAFTGNKVLSECLASPGRRFAGYVIEVAICLLLSLGAFGTFLTGFAGTLTGILGLAAPKQNGGSLIAVSAGMIVISLVSGTLLIAYIVWDFILMARGQTPGKKMLGMVVVSEDEMRSGFWTMFLRQIVLRVCLLGVVLSAIGAIPGIGAALSTAVGLLSNIWLLFDARRQQWYDKICKTYVMDMRNAKAAYE